ncbi:PTS lactose transporter subunit IIB [Virgibacillus dokdonensis]|uniref:Ascorbate-specific phosphotransferase enzyme IIB component n=1 Tax=Virgibacillus dokdonensis TaxID=302167 RepID=A0A2K9J1N0_9BACI|nr:MULTISPECIES: PTS sugar transporter subunit IIB [Virgibacillus]AUJ25862.1 Ascorbate-specific phosphotransferase enzyme IIB component [Virgibacillus dokdonensis]NWO14263.1 PTS sugar transporter subunit IIB [Virgibacillus sp.]RFA36998.1 PTS lactose transporter subunit IIB [Virgibacillus dokdonensis]
MIKIVTVCGAGVGSSMMLRVYAQQVLSEEGIQATVEASDISSVSADEYDIVITTSDFADILRNSKAKVVRIDNMMDKELLRTELMKVI